MILVAIVLPWLYFLLRGKIPTGLICLFLQMTIIGWLPAAIWAIVTHSQDQADARHRDLIETMKNQQS